MNCFTEIYVFPWSGAMATCFAVDCCVAATQKHHLFEGVTILDFSNSLAANYKKAIELGLRLCEAIGYTLLWQVIEYMYPHGSTMNNFSARCYVPCNAWAINKPHLPHKIQNNLPRYHVLHLFHSELLFVWLHSEYSSYKQQLMHALLNIKVSQCINTVKLLPAL